MNRLARLLALLFAPLALGQSTVNVGPVQLIEPQPALEQVGAFGLLKTVTETPVLSLQFQYNINTEKVSTTVANGGTVTQANSEALLKTSTATNGSALMTSKRDLRYTPGQGLALRFTARFPSGCVANSQQEAGFGNATDGLYFGCQGAVFGIIYRRGGVDTFIPRASWDDPTEFDPTKGNVYGISYQWLGYGVMKFVRESADGSINQVHRIRYAGLNTQVSLTNPAMGFRARVVNSGNTSDLTLAIPSVGIFAEGPVATRDVEGAAQNRKTGVGATLTNILTIRNNATFAGVANTTNVVIADFAVACSSDCALRVIRNATLGGSPSFADFDATTSVVSVDTAGTTVTGGRFITGTVTDTGDDSRVPRHRYVIAPEETLTFAAASITGSANINALASWLEEF